MTLLHSLNITKDFQRRTDRVKFKSRSRIPTWHEGTMNTGHIHKFYKEDIQIISLLISISAISITYSKRIALTSNKIFQIFLKWYYNRPLYETLHPREIFPSRHFIPRIFPTKLIRGRRQSGDTNTSERVQKWYVVSIEGSRHEGDEAWEHSDDSNKFAPLIAPRDTSIMRAWRQSGLRMKELSKEPDWISVAG